MHVGTCRSGEYPKSIRVRGLRSSHRLQLFNNPPVMLNDWLKLGRQRKQISTADDPPTHLNSLKQWIIVRTDVCGGCDVIETNRRHKTGRSPGRCDGAGMHREVLLVIDSHIDPPPPHLPPPDGINRSRTGHHRQQPQQLLVSDTSLEVSGGQRAARRQCTVRLLHSTASTIEIEGSIAV